MSGKIAAEGRHGSAGKSHAFARGNEADVRQNRRGGSARLSGQKSRLLPAETKLMSGKIAAGDFAQ
jgi:hypothetical protein